MATLSQLSKDFLWGGAIAANQAEGAYNVGGKGLSLMDIATAGKKGVSRHFTDGIQDHVYYPNHDGVDFYHHYQEDLAMCQEMALDVFEHLLPGAVFFLMEMKNNLMRKV